MTYSPAWDTLYQDPTKMNPGYSHEFHHIIREFINPNSAILELGCSGGGNIQLFLERRYDYVGIDGCESAVFEATRKFPSLRGRLLHLDFTKDLGPYKGMHAVVDRASLVHNDTESIKRCLGLIWNELPAGGLFICSDWFSTNHSEFKRGDVVDENTRCGYTDGQFVNAGNVHFSSESELRELFAGWRLLRLTEKITKYTRPDDRAHWIGKVPDGDIYTSAVWEMAWIKE